MNCVWCICFNYVCHCVNNSNEYAILLGGWVSYFASCFSHSCEHNAVILHSSGLHTHFYHILPPIRFNCHRKRASQVQLSSTTRDNLFRPEGVPLFPIPLLVFRILQTKHTRNIVQNVFTKIIWSRQGIKTKRCYWQMLFYLFTCTSLLSSFNFFLFFCSTQASYITTCK